MLRTPLCDLLGIEVPILSAPMGGGVAGARLAAAVSEAGALGLLGGTTERGADWLREQIDLTRSLTSKPFGVGFISHLPSVAPLSAAALERAVRIVCHSFVDPAPFMPALRDAGVIVIAQVGTLESARRAAAAGVDVIVAQGTEAGGHTGRIATLPLVPAVVDAVHPIPVVAAGGIADGRGVAAALMLGAQGVLMGTRFLATPESEGRTSTRARVVQATTDDTVLTEVFDLAKGMPWPPGVLGRSIRNEFADSWHGREAELRAWSPEQRLAYRSRAVDDADAADVYAGEAVGLIHSVEPAGVLVRRIAAEAEQVLRERSAAVLGGSPA
jgi:nitronate monooxygenase